MRTDDLTIVFAFQSEEGEIVTHEMKPIYKNPKLIALNVPDMGETVPVGNHILNLEFTING